LVDIISVCEFPFNLNMRWEQQVVVL
jgi:hypothetical protein